MLKKMYAFDEEIKSIWKYPVLDGIVNLKKYKATSPKILWILKEANKSEGIKEIWDHREFHEDVTSYLYWYRTYTKIIYVSYGIINNILNYNSLPPLDENAFCNGDYVLNKIAIINLNKGGGSSRSNNSVIKNHYFKNKDFHHRQIKAFKPDIIINASGVWELFSDLTNDEYKQISGQKLFYSIKDNQLIINWYHPNARLSEPIYINTIFKAVKKYNEFLSK